MSESKKPYREFWIAQGYHADLVCYTEKDAIEIDWDKPYIHVIEKSAYDKQQSIVEDLLKALEEIRWSWGHDAGRQCDNIAYEAIAKAKRELGEIK